MSENYIIHNSSPLQKSHSLVYINVTSSPTKVKYIAGEALDFTGLEIKAHYPDTTDAIITGDCTPDIAEGTVVYEDTTGIVFTYIDKENNNKQYTVNVPISVKRQLDSIYINTPPTNTTYKGDGNPNLDLNGIEIKSKYLGGKTEELVDINNCTITKIDKDGNETEVDNKTVMYEDIKSIKISYTDPISEITKFVTQDITVLPIPKSLTLPLNDDKYHNPTKTIYPFSALVDISGLSLLVTYFSGATKDITEIDIESFDPHHVSDSLGTQQITLIYTENETSVKYKYTVSTVETPNKLEITTQANNTVYYNGDSIDTTGMVVTASYPSGDTAAVKNYVLDSYMAVNNTDTASITQKITVSYTENQHTETTSFDITVRKKAVSLQITHPSEKLDYKIGETIQKNGLDLTVTYNDDTTKVLKADEYSISPETAEGNPGQQTVTITYVESGVTVLTTYTINITHAVSRIAVTTLPSKTVFNYGDPLDIKSLGTELTVYYNDNTSEVVDPSTWTYSPMTAEIIGNNNMTVSYTDDTNTTWTTTFVFMIKNVLEKITLDKLPSNTSYYYGDLIDFESATITAHYKNKETAPLKAAQLSWNPTTATFKDSEGNAIFGNNNVVIEYTENGTTASVNLPITVRRQITKIEITTPPTETSYLQGETIDTSGMVVKATSTDSETPYVVTDYTINPTTAVVYGDNTIVVSYTENDITQNAEFTVTSNPRVDSIEVTTPLSDTTYLKGHELDIKNRGVVVTATYTDGTSKELASTDWTFTPEIVSDTDGENTITITYDDGINEAKTCTTTYMSYRELDSIVVEGTESYKLTDSSDSSTGVTSLHLKKVLGFTSPYNAFDITLTAKYKDGTSDTIYSGYTIDDQDGPSAIAGTEEGEFTAIVKYTERGVKAVTSFQYTVVDKRIWGVQWNKSPSPKFNRVDSSVGITEPVPAVGTGEGSSPFDTIYPWSEMAKFNIGGNTVVRIPKFYVKIENFSIRISKYNWEGYTVCPACMDRGDGQGERDYIYVGRYPCSNTYGSVTGTPPVLNTNRATLRTNIHNIGDNYWQWDISAWLTISYLAWVEYGTFDMQAAIGSGYTNPSNTAPLNNGATDVMTYHTGRTAGDDDTVCAVQYRWIENPWGNAWQTLDGINVLGDEADSVSTGTAYLVRNPAKFKDYEDTDTTVIAQAASESDATVKISCPSNQYPTITSWGGLATVYGWLLPSGVSSALYDNKSDTSNAYTTDMWFGGYSDWRMLMVGGSYDSGKLAGLSAGSMEVNPTDTVVSKVVTSRLMILDDNI